jgi:GDPmannose 4,6-dehydratase
MKRAFITGIAGQDGSYLAELLLEKNYEVHGLVRRHDAPRLQHLLCDSSRFKKRLHLHGGDLEDTALLREIVQQSKPNEIYHLAAQSHVGQSFEKTEQTCRLAGLGTLQLLEIARQLPQPPGFFHASSSEIFGQPARFPQDESSPFSPVTPYGCAKTFATNLVQVYRQTFGLFAVNGILYNHESPRRAPEFVVQKICHAAAAIKSGRQHELVLGNTTAQRDWGHARDYVRGMWSALQHKTAENFIFATGKLHSVQDVVEIAFARAGLDWQKYVRVDRQLFRPVEPQRLVGDPTKAKQLLDWRPETSFEETIFEMTDAAGEQTPQSVIERAATIAHQ